MLSRAYHLAVSNGLDTGLVLLTRNASHRNLKCQWWSRSSSSIHGLRALSGWCSHNRDMANYYQHQDSHHHHSLFINQKCLPTQTRSYSSFLLPPCPTILSIDLNLASLGTISKCHHSAKNAAALNSATTSPSPTSSSSTSTSSSNGGLFGEFTKTYTVNHFSEPNMSWNETIAKARSACQYDMDLYQRMMTDYMLGNYLDYRKMESNKSFQEFISHFFRTYNYQVTGLVTILFTKLFLYSKHFWPESFGVAKQCTTTEAEHAKLESDLVKLAECYDMISYGFYFHDTISHLDVDSYEKSLRNLLILLGDYFLVKSSYDVASFSRIDLYKIYVQTVSKCSEGESLSLDHSATNGSSTSRTYENNPEVENDFYLNNDQSQSCYVPHPSFVSADESKSINKLINYCYLTSGHLVASSLQSAFYLANFSHKAQMLAFEFGKNIGMAIKISNQLSAQFVSKLANGDVNLFNVHNHQSRLPVNHLNVSYFAKFPTISIEVMQYLLTEYVNRSIKLLGSLCEAHSIDDANQLNLNPSDTAVDRGQTGGLSEQSAALMETLIRVINEIQCFNQQNIISSNAKSNHRQHTSTTK